MMQDLKHQSLHVHMGAGRGIFDHAEDIYRNNSDTAVRLKSECGLCLMESLKCDLTASLLLISSNFKYESDDESAERTIDKNRRELW
jgi:hypothetical protein